MWFIALPLLEIGKAPSFCHIDFMNLHKLAQIRMDAIALMWLCICSYLIVDTIGGFFAQQLGLNLRISQLYKVSMLLLGSYILYQWRSRYLVFVFVGFTLAIIGPVYRVVTDPNDDFFSVGLIVWVRVLLFFIVLSFCIESFRRLGNYSEIWARRSLFVGFWVMAANVCIGFLGLGFPTYPNTGVGFKGFFQAGNELSALFVLLSSFMLHHVWESKGKLIYLVTSIFVVLLGVSIATKAGVLFSALVVILMPFVSLRGRIFSFKAIFIGFIGALVLTTSIYNLFTHIEDSAIYARFIYYFENNGLLGFIFSGREVFTMTYWSSINDINGLIPLLFGSGGDVLLREHGKIIVEIDPIDLMLYFGVPTMMAGAALAIASMIMPLRKMRQHYYAPGIFLANGALFFFAFLAGHVWISGLLGIAWATYISMLSSQKTTKSSI